jgi:5-formyltetrahydrofolate cyclo-ligase
MPDSARDAESPRQDKIALRYRLITKRRLSDPVTHLRTAVAVQTVLISVVRAQQPARTAAYVPVGSEPGGADLPTVLAAALPPGSHLLLPVLLPDNDLDWAEFHGDVRPARRGLLEPEAPPQGVDAVRDVDLMIVPALAVDRSGHRLGRGGGSYDRALSRASNAFTIALIYDDEFLDTVPAEPHDRPVDAVITPTGGLRLISDTPDWTK